MKYNGFNKISALPVKIFKRLFLIESEVAFKMNKTFFTCLRSLVLCSFMAAPALENNFLH